MIVEGHKWSEYRFEWTTHEVRTLTLNGDTSINGLSYKILNSSGYDSLQHYYLREDTVARKVFYCCGNDGEYMIYYFGNVGDTIEFGFSFPYPPAYIDSISSVIPWQVSQFSQPVLPPDPKFYYLSNELVWLEGVGDIGRGLLFPFQNVTERMLCLKDSSQTMVFENPYWMNEVIPPIDSCDQVMYYWQSIHELSTFDVLFYAGAGHVGLPEDLIREADLYMFSSLGRLLAPVYVDRRTLDVNHLSPGVYFISLTDRKGHIRTARFMKH